MVWIGRFAASWATETSLVCGQEDNTKCQPAGLGGRIAARGLKQRRHCGLHYLADCVARKRIQYETYDLTGFLHRGRNQVGMLLGDGWYCGHVGNTAGNDYGNKPEGLCQIEVEYTDGTREEIVSDSAWKGSTGAIRTDDLLMGETYDARRELAGWPIQADSPGSEAGAWSPVEATPRDNDTYIVGAYSPTVRQVAELHPRKITVHKLHVVRQLGKPS